MGVITPPFDFDSRSVTQHAWLVAPPLFENPGSCPELQHIFEAVHSPSDSHWPVLVGSCSAKLNTVHSPVHSPVQSPVQSRVQLLQ